ncbi:hypothetical protein FBD94_16305 [Pedobacter hiemivivus]|uniref:Uncharacterized protein n=1 Tax=Pedobacter hiemivivus TaxID=2530454 RepID=A0A4U1G8L6_9SPHI|nr:hypothetical protein [Pedobacter hiemivivus]TKC59100.1 hypothetical protein FBD94_16305 [Pedobacter hiemivivus]
MKRSRKPTEHILIKANTTSDWDRVEFAIIYATASWKALIQTRLQAISQFKADKDFNCHSFWDRSISYYNSPDRRIAKGILGRHEDWAYITFTPEEELTFMHPENQIEAHQLLITANGIAHYKAYAKHTDESYWTEEFNLNKLMPHSPTSESKINPYIVQSPGYNLMPMNCKNLLATLIISLLLVLSTKAQQVNEATFFHRSELSKWSKEITMDRDYDIERGVVTGKYATNGTSLADLYNIAYYGKSRWTAVDSNLYGRVYKWPVLRLTDFEPFNNDVNTQKGFYNYALSVPNEKQNKPYMQYAMQCDLKKYFGYNVEEERQDMPCWMLTMTEKAAQDLRSKAVTSSIKGNSSGFAFKKVKMARVLQEIMMYNQNEDPILDMANITYEIDLTIKADMTNLEDLRKVLAQQGIILMKARKLMTVLVISDPSFLFYKS